MQFPFETVPDAAAIPIIFATKTTWAGIARDLPEQARQFASANDFTGKPGKCLTLPAPDKGLALVTPNNSQPAYATRLDAFAVAVVPDVWQGLPVSFHAA